MFSLWNRSDESKLTAELQHLMIAGQLRPILDRLDDLLPSLPTSGDMCFFRSLARALVRSHDWFTAPEENRAIAEDAATHLMQLALRDEKMVPRVRAIVYELERSADLILLPYVLRKHLFRWGLTVHGDKPSSGPFVLDKYETEALSQRTTSVFRTSLVDGTLVKRVPTAEAIFALLNTNKWDFQLRASLTKQLETPEARRSLAALIVPPGYTIDRATLDELFDAENVLAAMLQAKEGRTVESWSDQCLLRLLRVLQGEDPTFTSVNRGDAEY